MADFKSECTGGEICWCGMPATNKVEETIFHDDPHPARHGLTSYICTKHFNQLMNIKEPEKMFDPQDLDHGLYKIFWKKGHGGGSSLACVGSLHSGKRWFACSNWVRADEDDAIPGSTDWSAVKKVEIVLR